MKTKIEIIIESKNIKTFVPEEGMRKKDCSKKELIDTKKEVEQNLHTAIKMAIKHFISENGGLEEAVFDCGELPEVETFKDIGKISIKVE